MIEITSYHDVYFRKYRRFLQPDGTITESPLYVSDACNQPMTVMDYNTLFKIRTNNYDYAFARATVYNTEVRKDEEQTQGQ